MTNDEEYARGDETSWQVLRMGKKTTKLLREQRSKQSRKKDRSHSENGRTVLRQLPDHRWLWDLVAVVVRRRRRHVAVVCVVAAAGVVVLLLSSARSIPIICSFVQREYNSNIYLLEFMYLVLATIISRVGVSRFVRVRCFGERCDIVCT